MTEKMVHSEAEQTSLIAGRRLKMALGIIVVFMIVEVAGGVLSNSLALIGDAGHMLTDALALGLSLFAINLAGRPANQTKTYGYHRAEIMAALANGTVLILVSIYIFYQAYQRFMETPAVKPPLMLAVAGIGLVANLAAMSLLRKSRSRSLNIKAAFWHIVGDTVSSVGVIAAGLIILFTGWYLADPIIAVIIGFIILWGAVRIVRESADILLEAVPEHIRIEKVEAAVKGIPGVEDMHDVHIWTITSGIYALSAHLSIEDQMVSQSTEILSKVNRLLADDFAITHTTLQMECKSCPTGLVCNLP
ncbi:MAG: hypothetical protein A2Z05_03280 [Chloroflexi bacterium RBG_16_60_22]|nr:MAG: hypothetical protein A2Z05_03280 [Chloroflexi bacterium RBG_16_60_22]